MLRFNRLAPEKNNWLNKISIHPMLRFNFQGKKHTFPKIKRFQYILCYGSTFWTQRWKCYYDLISIHPMLRFNAERMTRFMPYIKFQYILCYGSTLRENSKLNSHIRFQYILCYGSTLFCFLVLFGYETFQYILCYGSTGFKACDISATFISIHPMLRFNGGCEVYYLIELNFNTSYVTVQHFRYFCF